MMTFEDIYNEFCRKFPDAEIDDFRPACSLHIPQLTQPIPYSIIVWLKDGSKIIYIANKEE